MTSVEASDLTSPLDNDLGEPTNHVVRAHWLGTNESTPGDLRSSCWPSLDQDVGRRHLLLKAPAVALG